MLNQTEKNLLELELPEIIRGAFDKLSEEKQISFLEEYKQKKKRPTPYVLMAIFFPFQLFFLNRVPLGFFYWGFAVFGNVLDYILRHLSYPTQMTSFLLSVPSIIWFIWYIIEIFRTPSRVRTYNSEMAITLMRDWKMMQSIL